MKNKFEFSKIVMLLVLVTYFVGLGFGMAVILRLVNGGVSGSYLSTALCGLFSFIGAPVATAIAFYSYKAKAENVEKIKGNYNVGSSSIEEEPLVETEEWSDGDEE